MATTEEGGGAATPPRNGSSNDSSLIAVLVVSVSLAIIGILSLIAIFTSKDTADGSHRVLTIVLPVIAAWVGTVLAFYFSRENYAAASQSTAQLVTQLSSEQRLRATRADEAMIPIARAETFTLNRPESQVLLKADLLDAVLVAKDRNRLPILEPDGRVKYVVHRSLIDRFLMEQVSSGATLTAVTLENLVTDAKVGGTVRDAFGTLRPDASLADAKALMDGITNCADVFVTEDGTRRTRATGWLTNVIVAERTHV